MLISSISNRKIHCCFLLLILFILIILALPLLLIWMANNHYEEQHKDTNQSSQESSPLPVNCTQFAIKHKLSLANEEFQCPGSTWPNRCRSCPRLCIEQIRNCNGKTDCPDETDEVNCHDSTGAAGVIFTNIFSANTKKANSSMFKPESCSEKDFYEERCPCVLNDPRVVICENLDITDLPDNLQPSVFKIKMSNNSIRSIDNAQWPRSLSTLVLVNNSISHIGARAFELAPQLKLLFLSHNHISYFDQEALVGLSQLTWLQMEANRLATFESSSLLHTPSIVKVYLSENMIDLPETTRFDQCCQNLRELLLDHNRISLIRSHWFSNLTSLMWLSLSHNEIGYIEDGSFDWNLSLEELNLSFNRIKTIDSQIFARNLGIKRLHLSNNPLRSLPKDAFKELLRLQSLNLTDVYFDHIEKETFAGLELAFIYFAKFRYCHYANHARVCLPLTDGLSSTEELLVFPILKAAVRIVALVCCLGNVFVFVWRSVSPHEHYTLSLYVRNLSIADLMMGIYLAAIGYKDWQFQEKGFRPHAIEWMSSGACTTIGFIAILSSELSVFVLTIITIERYRSIISTKVLDAKEEKRRARAYLTIAWILSFLIAAYPLFEWLLSNSDFYATNGLCLPLHIDQPFMTGWQYSAVVYLGINFGAVIIIIYLYVRMYARIMQARQQACPFGAMKREDAILATRFFFIVITDCVCWIPIVVIKIMALANYSIPSSIYGWLVVFIIPINSALNPIVYTLAAPTSMRAAICRAFKRACDRFDQLTTRTSGSRYSSHSSSSSESATLANMIDATRFRRKNTGSTNSTTFDAFDNNVITTFSSKPSVESALINYDCNSGLANQKPESSVPVPRIKARNLPMFNLIETSDRPPLRDNANHGMVEVRKSTHMHQEGSGVALRLDALTPSSSDLECPLESKNNGNKQQLKPAEIALNKLDSFSYRRRRQYAAINADSSSSSAYSSTSTANGINSFTNENKLNDSQADYLSTYEDNTGGDAPVLIDKMDTSGADSSGIMDGASSSLEDESTSKPEQQKRSFTELVNNRLTKAVIVALPIPIPNQNQQPHQMVVQARPDGNNTSELIKTLDPLQLHRSMMDSPTEPSNNDRQQQVQYPPSNPQQGRSEADMQVSSIGGIDNDDNVMVSDTIASLGFIVSGQQNGDQISESATKSLSFGSNGSERKSSRVSFNSRDSQTLLLSGFDKC